MTDTNPLTDLREGRKVIEQLRGSLAVEGCAAVSMINLPREYVAALLAYIDAVEAERNTFKAKSLSRGKLLERFRDHIQNMCDHAEDDGDRVYFGSTNDLDDLREIAREMDDWKWDAIMRERPEPDPYKLCRENLARAKAAERKLAEAMELLSCALDELEYRITDQNDTHWSVAARALVKGNQDAAE